jgi:hypothetical protein
MGSSTCPDGVAKALQCGRVLRETFWHTAINYNQLMRHYLKEGMSIEAADQMTQVKFKEDFIKACSTVLDHFFTG